MKNGNWIPISKGLTKHLPINRVYTELEAIYSMQWDYDENKSVTIAGYSDLWQWSRKKVRNLFERIGCDIIYPENTNKKQNQRGQIGLQMRDRSGTDKGQIRFIDNKDLEEQKNRSGTDKGQIRDRSGNTTRDTNTKTKTKTKDIVYPEWLDIELWNDFLGYRKRKDGKVLSQKAIILNLNKLIAMKKEGHEYKSIIETTIASNWSSFFPPKDADKDTDKRSLIATARLVLKHDGENDFLDYCNRKGLNSNEIRNI